MECRRKRNPKLQKGQHNQSNLEVIPYGACTLEAASVVHSLQLGASQGVGIMTDTNDTTASAYTNLTLMTILISWENVNVLMVPFREMRKNIMYKTG